MTDQSLDRAFVVALAETAISEKDRKLQVAEIYAARSQQILPLPWTNLSPPHTGRYATAA